MVIALLSWNYAKDQQGNDGIVEDSTQTDVVLEDSTQTDVVVEDSTQTDVVVEDSTQTDVVVEDSTQTDVVLEDSTQTDVVNSNTIVLVGLIFFSLTLVSLLTVTTLLFREVRWRKRHSKNESIIFPDAHLDTLEDLRSAWENLYRQITNYSTSSLSMQKENESLSLQTINSISQFNTTIDNQKNEIERLKEGYDFSIKKHSINSLIEIDGLLNKFLNEDISNETKEKLSKVNDYVKSHLEDLDIEEFNFKPGLSIRDLAPNDFKIVETEPTQDKHQHEKIMETVSNGYAFVHTNGRNIVKKAEVKVYKKEIQNG